MSNDPITPLPCPFCGHRSVSVTLFESPAFAWRAAICEKCAARGPELKRKKFEEGESQQESDGELLVRCIEAWNKRQCIA